MALGPQLDLRQSQSLVMTPQLQQAIKLLQYSAQELQEFIADELEQNPLLEKLEGSVSIKNITSIDSPPQDLKHPSSNEDFTSDSADYLHQATNGDFNNSPLDTDFNNNFDQDIAGAGSLDADYNKKNIDDISDYGYSEAGNYDSSSSQSNSFNDNDYNMLDDMVKPNTLRDHLIEQLGVEIQDPIEKAIGLYLIDLIEPTGWINPIGHDISKNLGVSIEKIEYVLNKLQRFDPPGIFARNLKECLTIQLIELGLYDDHMEMLLNHLHLLASRDFQKLIKFCKVDKEQLLTMIAHIKKLNPKPGTLFDFTPLQGSIPDILIHQDANGQFIIELNPETLPKLIINEGLYSRVVNTNQDKPSKEYIQEHRQKASWLIKSLRQRADTILKVTEEIIRQQSGFFHFGIAYLRPLVLKDIATATQMHESTISRVTANKFLSCNRGIFELKYFFTSTIQGSDGDNYSAETVRHRIKSLIDQETANNVYSDDQLVYILKKEGIELARRTIAKYREAMNIPSSVQRRRNKGSDGF